VFSQGLKGETTTLVFSIEKGKTIIKADVLEQLTETIPPSAGLSKKVKVNIADLPPGDYTISFGIRNGILPDAILSNSFPFSIK
jgi:hypothetical protein